MLIKIHTLYTYTRERRFTLALLAALVAILFSYIFLVGFATFNVSMQEMLGRDTQTLNSRIGDLESEYATLNQSVNRARAISLGFMPPKKEIFAFRQRLVQNGF